METTAAVQLPMVTAKNGVCRDKHKCGYCSYTEHL